MAKISGIYKITNKVNGKVYIGCSFDIHSRWKRHISNNGKSLATKAIKKYGLINFCFEILLECPKICFDYWEKFYISQHNSIAPNGYNLMGGGRYNVNIHQNTRKKISNALKGKSTCRKGVPCPNGSIAKLGNKNPMWGKSEEREGNKNPMYGKSNPHTDEQKDNMKIKMRGNTNGNRRCSYDGHEFDSVKDLAKFLGRNYCHLITLIKRGKFEGVVYL